MPDRDDGTSKWSGAREREERARQRALERERAKQARLAREAGVEPQDDARRLTDDERRTIREFRFPTPEEESSSLQEAPGPYPSLESGQVESRTAIGRDVERSDVPTVGTRWRDTVTGGVGGSGGGNGDGELPNLPGDDGGGGNRPGNGRLMILGAALLVIMAALAFSPIGPLGGGDSGEQTKPTPNPNLPSIFDTEEADDPSQPRTDDSAQVAAEGQAIVCIDPGHGGWDTGWNRTDQDGFETGPYGPPIVTEGELNLGMGYMLKSELEAMGYFVVMTREGGAAVNTFDQDVNGDGETRLDAENPAQAGSRDELQARINVCNDAEADIMVSIHIDGHSDASVRGFQVWYTAERDFGEQNAQLANLVVRRMNTASEDTDMANTSRGARPDTELENTRYETGTSNHLIMTGPDVPGINIVGSLMPGVIIESGFLSNDLDAIFIVQPQNQRLWVEAYALGIQDYFEQYPPGG